VFKRKIISVVAAFILAVGSLAPLTARGNEPTVETTPAITRAMDETQPPKPKGNKLARILSAPFRALAKLFGGGDDRKSVARESKKPEAQVAANASESKPPESSENEATEPEQKAAAMPGPQSSAVRAQEGARIVRPTQTIFAPERPAMFIPRIKGVPPDALSQGRALLQHGYLNEAIAELSVAATVGPGLVEANNLLGLAYDRIGWHKMAIESYQRALSVAPNDSVVLANLGNSLYLFDDYHAALKRLKQSARLSPDVPVVHNNIGIVQARLGKYDSAFKSFARASNEYDAHLKLAGILEIEKRERDAVRHYEAALRIQPGTAAVLERLVALYERTGRQREAQEARRTLGQPTNPQKTATGGG
jgi:Tfp pilus assembly protein PilF